MVEHLFKSMSNGNKPDIYYRPQRSWGKVIFSEACVNNSVHRGGMHGFILGGAWFYSGGHAWFYSGGHAWFYSGGHGWFYSGGMGGFIWGGHAWFYSGGRAWFYSGGGMHGFFSFFGYNEIRSMSGWYASYWNAFLFNNNHVYTLLS